MNAYLRDKLLQKLETMADERGYQVLDYVEFLESKYAERQTAASAAAANPLSRFADAVEEKLRAGRVSASTIAETMNLMNKAVGVLNGAAAAGKSVASDLMTATTRVVDAATAAASAAATPGAPGGASGTTGATGAAGSTPTDAGASTPPTTGAADATTPR
ncbi:MAG TPA: hypothetical protein VFS59_13685 [Gemmatimonadaceae bacterium]|nr:hypothetical protein [Gemmatimonadaceae bacterium]